MAALTPLDPAVELAREGVALLVTEAGRSGGGLVATVAARRGDAAAHVLRAVRLADAADRAAFAAEVAGDGDGATVATLLLELVPAVEGTLRQRKRPHASEGEYRATDTGLVLAKPGAVPVQCTNFVATIVAEVVADDGSGELRRSFELEARVHGRNHGFAVPAASFGGLAWVLEHLGAGAIVYPGQAREHARVAMQTLAGDVPVRRVYAHTGWRRLEDGRRVYLHAGGAIGAEGVVAGIDVELPDALAGYMVPPPPTGAECITAVRASLALVELGPPALTVPLLAATYRAALGTADFSLHLAGESGVFKTELAALAQQHWGAGLDARHLPASWRSTANAIENLAFCAKDAGLVVDDFAPTGDGYAIAKAHREADSLFRAQGNRAGRQRMRPDATRRPHRPPRGLIISTGEDVPRGVSLRARLFVLELAPGDVDVGRLTECQVTAAAGTYAAALAAFVQWAAVHADAVWREHTDAVQALRAAATASVQHRRVPTITAELAWSWRLLLRFAAAVEALTDAEAEARWQTGWEALGEAAGRQARWQQASDPARRFVELLAGAVASGRAHVAAPDGGAPSEAGGWGWHWHTIGESGEWRPRGDRIGWLEGEHLYLEPEASYASAQRLGRDSGDVLGLTGQSLRRRLRDRRLLASTDKHRETLTIRRVLESRRRDVLHLLADSLSAVDAEDVVVRLSGATPPPWSGKNGDPTTGDGRQPSDTQKNFAPVVGLGGMAVCTETKPGKDHREPGDWGEA